jgi:hypothetical protein
MFLFSSTVVTRNLVDPRLAAYVFDPEMKSYDFPFLATSFGVDQSPKKPSTSPKDSANIKRFFPGTHKLHDTCAPAI